MKIYGFPQKFIDIFQELYTNSRHCVKIGSGTTDYFKVETVMDWIMTKAMSPSHFGIIWQETKLRYLDSADDLALTKESEQMQ